MRRRTLLAAAVVSAPLALSACGSSSDAGYSPDPEALQVYSAQHDAVTTAWAEGFTKKTGIKVQIRDGEDGSMGHQIVEEGERSPADVFLTENSPAMTLVEDAGLFAPVPAKVAAQVPAGRRPSSGAWTSVAARSTVIVYNPEKIAEKDLPASLMDLQEPEWKGRWGAGAAKPDFQAIVAGMIVQRGEDETKAWLEGLKENAKIYENNIATMKAVSAGEVPMGVIYHYYWYKDQAGTKESSGSTKLHYLKNEDPGAFISFSGGGILKNGKHQAEARKFLEYVTSVEGQKVLADSGSMEYAVSKGATSDPALPPLDSLDPPTVDPSKVDSEKVATLMTDVGIL